MLCVFSSNIKCNWYLKQYVKIWTEKARREKSQMFSFPVGWSTFWAFFPSDFIFLALQQRMMMNYINVIAACRLLQGCFFSYRHSTDQLVKQGHFVRCLMLLKKLIILCHCLPDSWKTALLWKTEPRAHTPRCSGLGRWCKCPPLRSLVPSFPKNCLQAELLVVQTYECNPLSWNRKKLQMFPKVLSSPGLLLILLWFLFTCLL